MHKYIGSRKFYAHALSIMIPIMVQNGITHFVNMLDNLMVGRLGTTQMSGVAIANELYLVYDICIFGAVAGAGIFGAQFFGNGDTENFRNTFRFKLIFCSVITFLGIGIFLGYGRPLANLFLKGEGSAADAAASLDSAYEYIKVLVIGFLPYAVSQSYCSTLRESGKAFAPMIAGMVAVVVNLGLNYVFIFGHFGVPAMGVKGAAVATVISRFCEMFFIMAWTYKNRKTNPFITGVFKHFSVPVSLCANIFKKGFPLMINESSWAIGMAVLSQTLSLRGLNVVAANNICHTFWMVFSVSFIAIGNTIAIISGQLLGAGKHDEARDAVRKLIFLSMAITVAISATFALCSGIIPKFYNTDGAVREMAKNFILISAICMPLDAFSHACYNTLRSGGQVFITLIFDSGFVCLVMLPLTAVLIYFTPLSIYFIYAASQGIAILKCIPGILLIKKGVWVKTLSST